MDQPQQPQQAKKAPMPPAAYTNFLRIAQQGSEFFLAFGQVTQGEKGEPTGAHLVSSLVTTPVHLKAMATALSQAVARHEERFGAIAVPEPGAGKAAPSGGAASKAGSYTSGRQRSAPESSPKRARKG